MKQLKILISVASLAVLSLWSQSVSAETEVSASFSVSSVDDFNEPLSSNGYWVNVDSYGRCWRPAYVESYWRPYSYGEWVWTDNGWYWQSDEPWAWACYHYGRWTYDSYYGWVWVPDVIWGPAWVSFREGGGYVGWAPLPPGPYFSGGVIVVGPEVVPSTWFVFVGTRHFCEPIHPRTVIVNNITIVNKTKNITRIRNVNNTVINEGPRVDDIRKVNRTALRTGRVDELVQREKVPPNVRRDMKLRREPAIPRERQNQPQRLPQTEQPRLQPVTPNPAREHGRRPEIIRGAPSTSPERPQDRRGVPPGQLRREQVQPQPPPPGTPPAQREPQRGPPPGKGVAPPEEKPEHPKEGRGRGRPEGEEAPVEEPRGRER